MVTSHWPRLHGWPNKGPYFRELIKSYFCPALFSVDSPDVPVSFTVMFPCYQQFSWTDEKYRGKKQYLLTYVMLLIVIDCVLMNGLLPLEGEVSPIRIEYELTTGGVLAGYNVKDLIIDSVYSSKL